MVTGAMRVIGERQTRIRGVSFKLKSRWEIASGRCGSLRKDFSMARDQGGQRP